VDTDRERILRVEQNNAQLIADAEAKDARIVQLQAQLIADAEAKDARIVQLQAQVRQLKAQPQPGGGGGAMAHEAVPPGRGAAAHKPAGAKFTVEGAGEARANGFYKENGAPMTFGTHDCGSRTVDTNRFVPGAGTRGGKTKYCKVRVIATLLVELPHLTVHRPLLAT
jgi:hypothetical protein